MGNSTSDSNTNTNKLQVKISSCAGCCPFRMDTKEFEDRIDFVITETPSHMTREYHTLLVEINGESFLNPQNIEQLLRNHLKK